MEDILVRMKGKATAIKELLDQMAMEADGAAQKVLGDLAHNLSEAESAAQRRRDQMEQEFTERMSTLQRELDALREEHAALQRANGKLQTDLETLKQLVDMTWSSIVSGRMAKV